MNVLAILCFLIALFCAWLWWILGEIERAPYMEDDDE